MNPLFNLKNTKRLDLLATKLAEVRLSELGFRFIPGIYPILKGLSISLKLKHPLLNRRERCNERK